MLGNWYGVWTSLSCPKSNWYYVSQQMNMSYVYYIELSAYPYKMQLSQASSGFKRKTGI